MSSSNEHIAIHGIRCNFEYSQKISHAKRQILIAAENLITRHGLGSWSNMYILAKRVSSKVKSEVMGAGFHGSEFGDAGHEWIHYGIDSGGRHYFDSSLDSE